MPTSAQLDIQTVGNSCACLIFLQCFSAAIQHHSSPVCGGGRELAFGGGCTGEVCVVDLLLPQSTRSRKPRHSYASSPWFPRWRVVFPLLLVGTGVIRLSTPGGSGGFEVGMLRLQRTPCHDSLEPGDGFHQLLGVTLAV